MCLWPVGRWVAECDWGWKGGEGRSSRLGVPPVLEFPPFGTGVPYKENSGDEYGMKKTCGFFGTEAASRGA